MTDAWSQRLIRNMFLKKTRVQPREASFNLVATYLSKSIDKPHCGPRTKADRF